LGAEGVDMERENVAKILEPVLDFKLEVCQWMGILLGVVGFSALNLEGMVSG